MAPEAVNKAEDSLVRRIILFGGDTANVMDNESYETFDLAIPDELKSSVVEGCQVMYWIILDDKVMKQVQGS